MAATDLSAVAPTYATRRITLEATAGNAREVILPAWAVRVTVTFVQSDGSTADTGKIADAGTDTSAIGNDHFPVSSGGALTLRLNRGIAVADHKKWLYLAGGTNGGYAHVILEAE